MVPDRVGRADAAEDEKNRSEKERRKRGGRRRRRQEEGQRRLQPENLEKTGGKMKRITHCNRPSARFCGLLSVSLSANCCVEISTFLLLFLVL
jgi:hypothetical protein